MARMHEAPAASEPILMGCCSPGRPISTNSEAADALVVDGVGIIILSPPPPPPPATAGAYSHVPNGSPFTRRYRETLLECDSRHQVANSLMGGE